MTTFAFVPDLMDRSRLGGLDVTFVARPEELTAAREGDLVVVDLARPGVLGAVGGLAAGVRTIGFGSHVDRDLLDAARAAGCEEVMARSEFFRRARELLRTA
ncbi:MAG: hypothetical protein QOG87_3064 [Actinomycetota bacterium]|jgi:hypothetical protein